MANFETVTVETDLLILGGGMASCGAAVEAAHWAKKNNLKVIMVDKAAVDRSGAVAMGLSAINQYVGVKEGDNTIEDYVKYVKQDLMGVARDDLVASIARHVDGSVHLFEKWGLPIWKAEDGSYVHEGRWQLMINGESYKVIVAEAAKNNLGTDNIYERIFIVGPIMEGGVCKGAYGFSVREDKFYVFKARAVFVAMGGAVHVFKPRSSGEGLGRAWYPPTAPSAPGSCSSSPVRPTPLVASTWSSGVTSSKTGSLTELRNRSRPTSATGSECSTSWRARARSICRLQRRSRRSPTSTRTTRRPTRRR
jgi:adenylylsulfate reductase subunit A